MIPSITIGPSEYGSDWVKINFEHNTVTSTLHILRELLPDMTSILDQFHKEQEDIAHIIRHFHHLKTEGWI